VSFGYWHYFDQCPRVQTHFCRARCHFQCPGTHFALFQGQTPGGGSFLSGGLRSLGGPGAQFRCLPQDAVSHTADVFDCAKSAWV